MAKYKGIQGYSVQKLSADPTASSNTTGQLWYNSTTGKFKISIESSGAWSSGTAYPVARNGTYNAGPSTANVTWGGWTSITASNEYDGTTWTAVANMSLASAGRGAIGTTRSAIAAGAITPPGSTYVVTTEEWTQGQNIKVIDD